MKITLEEQKKHAHAIIEKMNEEQLQREIKRLNARFRYRRGLDLERSREEIEEEWK